MDTEQIELDRDTARELWRQYRQHQQYSDPIDREVARTYRAIAQGKVVIKALESIKTAGLGDDKLPKLAIVRAGATHCWLDPKTDGSVTFASSEAAIGWGGNRHARQRTSFPPDSFPGIATQRWHPRAIVPQIPLPLRPRRALEEYHVLFEAIWEMVPPVDPMLLRRIGEADLWVVVAAWELTEVERMALAARVHS